jgi:3'-5' exoribonuclease 1
MENNPMRYIIVDLEATCWEKGTRPGRQEIIEIGAVRLDANVGPASEEFACFVRPLIRPILRAFCERLTGISQKDVDQAALFPVAFERFLNWIGPKRFVLCSWGAYDLNQFRIDCRRHNIPFPMTFENHINLKKEFARLKGLRPMGMAAALRYLKLPLEGQHHRGIDDARNIARIAQIVLPKITDE